MALHEQLQMFHMVDGVGCGGGNQVASLMQQILPSTLFSGPESDLTCNLSGARKRPREEYPPSPPTIMNMPPSTNIVVNNQLRQYLFEKQLLLHDPLLPETTRPNHSAMPSTSGRPPLATPQPSPASSPSFSSGVISMIHHHAIEIDAVVRLHAQKLQSGLEEARKRQCSAAVAALEHHAQRRVAEKQAQLDAAASRNAELQDRLRQAAAESQAWLNVARNSEALIASLRASLEHALLLKLADCANKANDNDDGSSLPTGVHLPGNAGAAAPAEEQQEGYGDSEEEAAASASATAAVSSSEPGFGGEASSSVPAAATTNKPSAVTSGCSLPCKSCGYHDATVLLLPCRHLCLCPSCDASVAECPVCRRRKNATLNVNLS